MGTRAAYDIVKDPVNDPVAGPLVPGDVYSAHDHLMTSDEVFKEAVEGGATTILSTDTFTAIHSFMVKYPKSFAEVKDLIFMGGAFDFNEPNVAADAPATKAVIEAKGLNVWVMTTNVTDMVGVDLKSQSAITKLAKGPHATKEAVLVSDMFDNLSRSPGQIQWGPWGAAGTLNHYDLTASYFFNNQSAFTFKPTKATIQVTADLGPTTGRLVYVDDEDAKEINIAHWTHGQASADYMRYTHIVEMLKRPCITNQPLSFKELYDFWAAAGAPRSI